jgi:hypothetical protein
MFNDHGIVLSEKDLDQHESGIRKVSADLGDTRLVHKETQKTPAFILKKILNPFGVFFHELHVSKAVTNSIIL